MKTIWSRKWKSSKQPRKQRKYRANAPLHARRKLVSATLDKPLRKEYKKRSLPLRKGDEVKIMRGEFRGKTGKILEVDLKRLKVYVDGIKRKKVSGQEVPAPLDPSNLKVIKLETSDKMRFGFLENKVKK